MLAAVVSAIRSRVLVVDDDDDIREELREALEAEGFGVQTASNGVEALEVLEQAPPKVMLLDLHMPVMDGWALLEHIEKRNLKVHVMVMTAGRRGLPPRTLPTFVKPLRLPELVRAVERYARVA